MTAAAPTEPAPAPPPFVLRDESTNDSARARERHYVLKTWKRAEGEAIGGIERHLFGPWQERTMRDILARPGVRISFVSPRDDDSIAAWMVAEREPTPCIYYLFVPPELRRLGLARMLVGDLASRPTVYTRRPGRILGPNGWQPPSWFARTIPPQWRLLERANYYPLDAVDSGASGAWRGR